MNTKKVPRPNRSRRRTADHAKLEAELAQIEWFRAAGLTPTEALAAFRAGLSVDDLRDLFAAVAAHRFLDRVTPEGGAPLPESVARMAYDVADAMLKETVSP